MTISTFALYGTIWAAMILFVAAETAKARPHGATPGAWRLWAAGALLCAIHIVLAMAVHHAWSHEHAVRETAARSAEVYGFGWRGGLYLNYVFLLVWIAELVWWRASPAAYLGRSGFLAWTLRAFYAVIIVNAVVIFASPPGRVVGLVLCAWLGWGWLRSIASPRRLPATGRTTRSYPES
jgi:hypothetical protein